MAVFEAVWSSRPLITPLRTKAAAIWEACQYRLSNTAIFPTVEDMLPGLWNVSGGWRTCVSLPEMSGNDLSTSSVMYRVPCCWGSTSSSCSRSSVLARLFVKRDASWTRSHRTIPARTDMYHRCCTHFAHWAVAQYILNSWKNSWWCEPVLASPPNLCCFGANRRNCWSKWPDCSFEDRQCQLRSRQSGIEGLV